MLWLILESFGGLLSSCIVFFGVVDFFRGPTVSSVRLAGLEHVLHFTALEGKIYMRSYKYVCTFVEAIFKLLSVCHNPVNTDSVKLSLTFCQL